MEEDKIKEEQERLDKEQGFIIISKKIECDPEYVIIKWFKKLFSKGD